jgi:uncharacterized membrane protein
MSHQEKGAIVSLLSALIVFVLYTFYALDLYQGGYFNGPEAGSLVGQSAFVMIIVGIGVRILVQILFSVTEAIVTKEKDHPVTDERDKLIELKGMQIAFIFFSFSFLVLMGILALDMLSPHMVILLTILGLYLASIVADSIKIFLYRRGF